MRGLREIDPLLGELYLAGERVKPGTYRAVGSGRTIHLAQEGPLPASLDGHIACYARVQHTWEQIERNVPGQLVFSSGRA